MRGSKRGNVRWGISHFRGLHYTRKLRAFIDRHGRPWILWPLLRLRSFLTDAGEESLLRGWLVKPDEVDVDKCPPQSIEATLEHAGITAPQSAFAPTLLRLEHTAVGSEHEPTPTVDEFALIDE